MHVYHVYIYIHIISIYVYMNTYMYTYSLLFNIHPRCSHRASAARTSQVPDGYHDPLITSPDIYGCLRTWNLASG